MSDSMGLNKLSDNDLVVLAKNGSSDAYGALVRRYTEKMYNICYRLTGCEHKAHDLLQDTFITAFKSIKRFSSNSSLTTWLYKIAVNDWINKSNREKVVDVVSIDSDKVVNKSGDTSIREIIDPKQSPEKSYSKAELENAVQYALDKLTPEQRVAIVLRYIEGRPLQEIARICNESVSTIGSRLGRGLKEIKKYLKEYVKQ
ncbi:MAG: RNA polymerase sigma factor [Elusimicrobiota bacterium]